MSIFKKCYLFLCMSLFLVVSISAFAKIEAPSVKEPEYITNLLVKISWEKVDSAKSYNIYRTSSSKKAEKYSTSNLQEFIDPQLEANKEYHYTVTAIDKNNDESLQSKEIIVYTKFVPKGVFDVYPPSFKPGQKIIIYFSGKKSKEIRKQRQKQRISKSDIPNEPKLVYIRYGFDNWDSKYLMEIGKEPPMIYDSKTGYWTYELVVPTYIRELDFAFRDDIENWDNNGTKDYKIRANENDLGIIFTK